MNSNSTNHTPPNLAQSMAEEIVHEMNTNHLLDDLDAARQIIQGRIEPLVRVAEAAKELSEKCYCSDFPGLNPCPRCRVIEALSKL